MAIREKFATVGSVGVMIMPFFFCLLGILQPIVHIRIGVVNMSISVITLISVLINGLLRLLLGNKSLAGRSQVETFQWPTRFMLAV